AEAVAAGAAEKGLALAEAGSFANVPGRGIKAAVQGREIIVGTRRMMEENGVDAARWLDAMNELEQQGKTAMLVSVDGDCAGVVAVADTIKPTSREAVAALRGMGIDVVMITGDNERTARAIAAEAGIDRVMAEVLPEGKAEAVRKLQAGGV
ncbi:HAD-IC family P-type ATPase, partial [Paenibacillus zanthoxyli]|uniref:HAD-IC family P-type ATPase n=1 Tax=Paenibacillus zanthoxyli TaxID=369399 RepID=UPI00056B8FE5